MKQKARKQNLLKENQRFERRQRSFYKPLLRAILIWLLLAFTEYLIRDSTANYWFTQQAYSFLQSNLPLQRDFDPNIAIVDISRWTNTNNLEQFPGVPGLFLKTSWSYTDRRALKALIQKLAQFEPAAIGIDIDFSPLTPDLGGDGRPPPGQFDFFDACQSLKTPGGVTVPVFLGINRTIELPPAGWLNSSEHMGLASAICKIQGSSSHMPYEIKLAERTNIVPCMAKSLSESYFSKTGAEPDRPSDWLAGFIRGQSRQIIGNDKVVAWVAAFPVDFYTTLRTIEQKMIPAEDILDPSDRKFYDLKSKIYNHVILIGYAKRSQAYDTVSVPSEAEPVPGIYAHACATATLLQKPLFEVNEPAGLALSFVASMLIFILTQKLRKSALCRRYGLAALETCVTLISIALSLAFALALVRYEQILWLQVTVFWFFLLVEFLLNNATQKDLHIDGQRA